MTIWVTFSSSKENHSGAINPLSDELTCSRFKVNVLIPPKRATPPSGQAQYGNYLITCPTNIPALTAVDLGQFQCGLSICFPVKTVYLITTNEDYNTAIKIARAVFPPRDEYRMSVNSFNSLTLILLKSGDAARTGLPDIPIFFGVLTQSNQEQNPT